MNLCLIPFRSGGVSNVIFQNIHFTDLNPQYIWGGDALTLVGTDMVWIDHCKFSLVGRQMIVTGYEQAGRVTISNNEFDGVTEWSASCNNDHYWTMLFLGDSDKITLSNNYIHDTSGRSPKVGGSGDITMHAVNNFWYSEGGHAFDVHEGGKVLIEGNIMQEVDTPITESTAGGRGSVFNVPDSSAAATCSEYIGRECQVNSIVDSGDFPAYTATDVLSAFADVADSMVVAVAVDGLAESVKANAGIGKLSSSSSSTSPSSQIDAAEEVAASTSSAAPVNTTSSAAEQASSVAPVSSSIAVAATSSKAAASTATSVPSSSGGAGSIARYMQCGGASFEGDACEEGLECTFFNDWYSQCL